MLSNQLYNRPILDLRSGRTIGKATSPVINPDNLKIIGWWCTTASGKNLVLLATSVRDFSANGLVIDDEGEISAPDDLIRDKKNLEINYNLVDKQVRTSSRKIGKIESYAFEPKSMLIEKLYVQPSIIKSFNESTLIIGRNQIVEINDKSIVVRDTEVLVGEKNKVKNQFQTGAATA